MQLTTSHLETLLSFMLKLKYLVDIEPNVEVVINETFRLVIGNLYVELKWTANDDLVVTNVIDDGKF